MTLNEQHRWLDQMHFYIKNKVTGNAKDFAEKLGLHEYDVKNLLMEAQEMGANIAFSKEHQTYYYTTSVTIEMAMSFVLSPC